MHFIFLMGFVSKENYANQKHKSQKIVEVVTWLWFSICRHILFHWVFRLYDVWILIWIKSWNRVSGVCIGCIVCWRNNYRVDWDHDLCIFLSWDVPWSLRSWSTLSNDFSSEVPDFISKAQQILVIVKDNVECPDKRRTKHIVMFRLCRFEEEWTVLLAVCPWPELLWDSIVQAIHCKGDVSQVKAWTWLSCMDHLSVDREDRVLLLQSWRKLTEDVGWQHNGVFGGRNVSEHAVVVVYSSVYDRLLLPLEVADLSCPHTVLLSVCWIHDSLSWSVSKPQVV